MILGVGTDIVEISRIRTLFEKRADVFVKRLLADEELLLFNRAPHPERFLAKRWAAKEAISKALGTGITQGVRFSDIWIDHLDSGQPRVNLKGKSLSLAEEKGMALWSLSISDEHQYAVAFVVVENAG